MVTKVTNALSLQVDMDEELDASPLMLQGEVAALAERYAASVRVDCALCCAPGLHFSCQALFAWPFSAYRAHFYLSMSCSSLWSFWGEGRPVFTQYSACQDGVHIERHKCTPESACCDTCM